MAQDYRNETSKLAVDGLDLAHPPDDIGTRWRRLENVDPILYGTLKSRPLFDRWTRNAGADTTESANGFTSTVASGTLTDAQWPTWQGGLTNYIQNTSRVWRFNAGALYYNGTNDKGNYNAEIHIVEDVVSNTFFAYLNGMLVVYAQTAADGTNEVPSVYADIGICELKRPNCVVTTSPNGKPVAILGGEYYLDLSLQYPSDSVTCADSAAGGAGAYKINVPAVNDAGGTTTASTLPLVMAFNMGIDIANRARNGLTTSAVATTGGSLDSGVSGASNYQWRFTHYRKSLDVESRPSTASTAIAVTGANNAATVTVSTSDDPQVTHINVYRLGGTLDSWRYVGRVVNKFDAGGANDTTTYTDTSADSAIALNAELNTSALCPWYYSYESTSAGDLTEENLPGYECFGPFKKQFVFAIPTRDKDPESVGGSGILPTPSGGHADNTDVAKIWRDARGSSIVPRNIVLWTNISDFALMEPENQTPVGEEGEVLTGGFMFSSFPFVYNSNGFWALDYGGPNAIPEFTPRKLPLGMGASIVAAGKNFVFFKNDKGIFMTDLNTMLEEITIPIANLFRGDSANDVAAIDTLTGLRYAEPFLYVFYDDGSEKNVLVYDTMKKSWWRLLMSNLNDTNKQPTSAWFDPNGREHFLGFAGDTGDDVPEIWTFQTIRNTTGNETSCVVKALTASWDAGVPHTEKEWGVLMVDFDPNGADITIIPRYDNESVVGSTLTTGTDADTNGRRVKTFDLSDVYAKNVGFEFQWTETATKSPTIHKITILYRADEEEVVHWAHPDDSWGFPGWFHLRDGYFDIRSTADVTLRIVVDGTTHTYTLASTSGNRRKVYQEFDGVRGKVMSVELDSTTAAGFRFYSDTSQLYGKAWQSGLEYQTLPLAGSAGYAEFLRKGGGT